MLNLNEQKLLVIAPHPDDEVLGCGGLISRVKADKGQVFVLFMTVGDTQDYSSTGKSTGNERIKEIKRVANFLDYDGYEIALQGNEYHLQLDNVPRLVLAGIVEDYLKKIKPNLVLMPQLQDYNQDHVASAQAVLTATRPAPLGDKHAPEAIIAYRSVLTAAWAGTSEQNHNYYLELSHQDVETKAEALSLYGSQVRDSRHQRSPESIEKIARVLGIYAGTEFAESYYIHKLLTPVTAS